MRWGDGKFFSGISEHRKFRSDFPKTHSSRNLCKIALRVVKIVGTLLDPGRSGSQGRHEGVTKEGTRNQIFAEIRLISSLL